MTDLEIKLPSIDKLRKNFDFDVLVQPEVEDARDTILARVQRGGKGLGAKRNTLLATTRPLGATVQSTRNFPRTKGTSWGSTNEAIVRSMAPNVLRKMVQRIGARWASAS